MVILLSEDEVERGYLKGGEKTLMDLRSLSEPVSLAEHADLSAFVSRLLDRKLKEIVGRDSETTLVIYEE